MEITCRVYRPRDPRKTPLFGLLDSLYDRVKGAWEERFERSYGFWRGLVDEVVARYLDCGIWAGGFARVRCRRCPEEFLVAFSCKGRGCAPHVEPSGRRSWRLSSRTRSWRRWAMLTQPAVIKRILDHLRKRDEVSRPPPAPQPVASPA